MAKALISIVGPVYCEKANIAPLYEEVCKLFCRDLSRYDFELIFMNEGLPPERVRALNSVIKPL